MARQLSQRSIFEALLLQRQISRADLAKVTGLSKQTTSEVIDSFEQQGLVRPVGRTSGSVGRTAVLYELSPDGGYCLGVDLGGTKLSAAFADISGNVLAEGTEPTDARGGIIVLEQIARLAARLARETGIHPSRIRSIVVGTPGVVNAKTGAIELAPNVAHLGEMDVVAALSDKLGVAVIIENDVNLGLLGEIWQGRAQNLENVAFIALGTGIGLGLCVDGQLIRGENGAAGEIGYFPIGGDPSRPEARQHGCLEYEAGAAGILRRYRESGGEADSVPTIFERQNAGELLATRIIDETAALIAQAAAIVMVTADPKLIVLGGSIGARDDFAANVVSKLSRLALRRVELQPSALGNRAGVVGAVAVALNRLHEDLFGIAELSGALPLPAPKTAGAP